MSEIELADRRQRRIALVVLAVGLILGVIALLLAQAHFREIEALIERDRDAGTKALIVTIRWFIVFLVVPMAGLIGYLGWFALRIIRGQRFPPMGSHILRNTAVLEGRHAVVRGWILAFVTLLIALAVLQLAVSLWTLAEQLAHDDNVKPPPSIEAAPL